MKVKFLFNLWYILLFIIVVPGLLYFLDKRTRLPWYISILAKTIYSLPLIIACYLVIQILLKQ